MDALNLDKEAKKVEKKRSKKLSSRWQKEKECN